MQPPADVPSWLTTVLMILGPPGAAGVMIAFFGMFRLGPRADSPKPVPQPPSELMNPWLVQTLVQIEQEIKGIKVSQDTITQAVSGLAVQSNTVAAQIAKLAAFIRKVGKRPAAKPK